jgi:hypothetical protein
MKTTQLLLIIPFCTMFINLNAQIDIKGKVKNQSTGKLC